MNGHGGRKPKPNAPTPAFVRTATELGEYVALVGAERVAEVLGLRVSDLEPLLAGRVKPSDTAIQRLRSLVRKLGC